MNQEKWSLDDASWPLIINNDSETDDPNGSPIVAIFEAPEGSTGMDERGRAQVARAVLCTAAPKLYEALWAMVNCFGPRSGVSEDEKESAVKQAAEALQEAGAAQ